MSLSGWIMRRELRKQAEQFVGRRFGHKEIVMFNALLGNWKTTVLGIAAAALQLHQGGLNWHSALVAAVLAALGISAKDATTGSKAIQ